MTKLYIEGGRPLNGTIAIDSSKNALLPIIAGTILTNGVTVLKNVPKISDIENLLKILVSLNIRARFKNGDLEIDTRNITYSAISPETAGKIRGSIFVLGAIVGRFGVAQVPYPGGCAIGARAIDLHLQAFKDLGIRASEKNNIITCKRGKSSGAEIFLDFPSVGATENAILASVLGSRRVRIINCAREPEVTDLCNFLNSCGAMICGQGSSTITVQGVKQLNGCTYSAIPDRINTGTYMIAVACCGGDVTFTNTVPMHNANLISKLRQCGCDVITSPTSGEYGTIRVTSVSRPRAMGVIHTAPYPGFPTDLQSQIATLASMARGTTIITENLFENRFQYMDGLKSLGAKLCAKDKTITINGVGNLSASYDENYPTKLNATDLRGGVSLVIAGLCSPGWSVINNADYIYRGYQNIDGDLIKLGANIIRVDD